MSAFIVFVVLAVICIAWYIVASIQITNYLTKHGVKINWLLVRVLLPSYANQYKKLTRAETGKTGSWFYHWVIAINGLWVFAVIVLLMKVVFRSKNIPVAY
jgi:hypothetical protein